MKRSTPTTLAAIFAVALPLTPVSAQDANTDNENVLEEVMVTGIRSSIRQAEAIKSEARNIVEAITPEDLGKFSDDSIAESLQRLPGVQVEEDYVGSRGDQVSIRGLGPQFVVATVNGRTAWSSGSGEGFQLRSYNFSVIPSEVVNEVLVTKTPMADTVESGLGGAVDVRTMRPLSANYDDRNWLGRFEARGEMVDIGDSEWGPRLSGVLAGKNDEGTLGAYVAFNYSDIPGGRDRQQVRYRTNRDFYVDNNNNFMRDDDELIEDATTIRDILYSPDRWDLKRGGIAAALEFRPTDELMIVADVLYTTFERENNRPNTRMDVERQFRQASDRDPNLFAPGSIILEEGGIGNTPLHTTFIDINGARCIDDGVEVQGAECSRRGAPRALSLRDQIRNNYTDTTIGGLNIDWNRDNWYINGDLFWNDLDAVVLEASMDANNQDLVSPLIADLTGSGPPQSGVAQEDLDLNRFEPRRLRIRQRSTQGDQVGARLDFDVEMANQHIESVQFGARYNSSDIDYSASQRASWDDGGADDDAFFAAFYTDQYFDPVDGVALPMVNFLDSFNYLSDVGLDGEVDPGFGPCTTGNVAEFMKFNGRFDPKLTRTCEDLLQSFAVTEDTYSAYAAINLEGDWGNVPVFANLGLRYVKTENKSTGVVSTEIDEDTDISPEPDPNDTITTSGSFSKVLPSLNLRFDMTDRVQLRFAAAETLSRPEVYDLTSRFKISVSDDDDSGDITPEDCEGGGCLIKRGNPNLDPYTAWNYDLTLMWAMPGDGFLATSIFYKDIEGFIFDAISGPVTLPEYGDAPFFVEQPTNAEDAKVSGFEIAIHQPFTFLPAPWDGFGVQFNYSYVDSEFSAGTEAYDSGKYGLPGASPNNLNTILYFETARFGARLSYVYRDDYFSSFGGGAFSGVDRYVKAKENLSVNLSYDITDYATITAKASNLTDDVQEEFITFATLMQSYYTRPRTYSVGVRIKF
ncbi:MAG: TonB-dependent receptor [Gammaproteobacteria bacterium]|nr:TonB-dependent receptor [Gammaproteobacteria bacterium]